MAAIIFGIILDETWDCPNIINGCYDTTQCMYSCIHRSKVHKQFIVTHMEHIWCVYILKWKIVLSKDVEKKSRRVDSGLQFG